MQTNFKKFERESIKFEDFQKEMREVYSKHDDFQNDMDGLQNHLATVENFIEKYLPISIQYQIGETFINLMPERDHN